MLSSLVELHSVFISIDKIEGASNEIYGEIKVEDPTGRVFEIYKEEKNNAKSVLADGTLPLTGPSECIINPLHFVLGVSLKEKYLDLEVSNGYLCMSPDMSDSWFGKPVSVVIQGDHGYAVVHLSLFNFALQATVDVALVINGDTRKPQYAIHGDIVAGYDRYQYRFGYPRKYHQSKLFGVPQDKPVELLPVVEGGDPINGGPSQVKAKIPLTRCKVAVPAGSVLLIEANLCEDVGISSDSSQDCSAQVVSVKGTASFPADWDTDGTKRDVIVGEDGHIEVEVTWFADVEREAWLRYQTRSAGSTSPTG